jgi:alpha-1,3-rhamnosyl/mannosyltransferase
MMRVVINQLAALGRKTGIGHYASQLLRSVRRLAPEDHIEGFPHGLICRSYKALNRAHSCLARKTASSARANGETGATTQAWLRSMQYLRNWRRVLVGRYFQGFYRRGQYDLYHEPNGVPLPADCPTVTTLHDLSVLLYPQWHPADRVAYYEHHFRRSLSQCIHFLVVSEFSRREVIQKLGIPAEKVTRTYNGIRAGLEPRGREQVEPMLRRLGLPAQYLLYLGTLEPRKNVLMLMKAYCDLPQSLRSAWPLLMVGDWGWNTATIAEYWHNEARHRGVLHLGYLKDRHLAAVYNGARALVYPSWYEGFGLPPLEMMACGGAVLASTAPALVETVGRRAQLIAPGDLAGWRDAMAVIVEDDDWWQLLRRGVQDIARPYTWERCATQTLDVYRRLCGLREKVSRAA